MRQPIAIFLALLFGVNLPAGYCAQGPAQPNANASSVKDQVTKLPLGTFIEVRFADKTKVRGHLSSVEPDGFSLRGGTSSSAAVRQTAFGDVKSVKVVTKAHTPVGAWIAVGAIAAVVVIVVSVIAVERHNE